MNWYQKLKNYMRTLNSPQAQKSMIIKIINNFFKKILTN